MEKCDKCKKETTSTSTSYLSMETLCPDCKELETSHPLYEFGKRVEREEVKNKNFNFEGILHGLEGKPAEINLMAQIKFKNDPENIGKAFSNFVNNLSFNPSSLSNAFSINGIDFVDEAKSWVYYMANTNSVDARNIDAKESCASLNIPEQPLLPVAKYMSREHRTLQQSYTRFVLEYLLDKPSYLPLV